MIKGRLTCCCCPGGRATTAKHMTECVSVHVPTGIVQLLLQSHVLTGLFHDAAQGTLDFGQQPRTHLLKLASGDT